ncbi:MAG: ABC transporter substrate-binding protein, partial [Eubacteriales bacterium]|nr:ABC transporter substrate-binding protein [Eubacteriales bacterium]
STIENSLATINTYYRKILMITGPEPDEYRDYYFQRLIPDVVKGLKEQSAILQDQSDKLTKITGNKGEHSAQLDKISVYLNRMGTYTSTIAASMKTLKDYLAALGTWLTDTQNQPLYLDYICIQAVEAEAPQAEPGFFQSFWGELQKFWMSFFADYNSIGSMTEEGVTTAELEKVAIEVWTTTSREQAQIIRSLVDDNFSSIYNIPVEVKLVVAGTLLPATLAGTGPDISMGSGQGDPVNYAIRSAVKSLNTLTGDTNVGYNFNDFSRWADNPIYSKFLDKIDTFDEVTERFAEAAMVPITLYGETYALPETMNFPMMFYRKDIFAELGIEVPNTWEDFYDIIYTLQANMLDMGVLPGGVAHATIRMYQQNEQLYDMGDYDRYLNLYRENGYTDDKLKELGYAYTNEDGVIIPKTDGMTINLDSDLALAAFKEECELFTVYDFPYQYNLATRFRQGIMPIAIADYSSTYNTLIVFAPEIKGLWEFTPLPGTPSIDGKINNTTVASITAMIMMRSVTDDNALAAWTFMQWWTNAEVQSAYGNEMVALLGPSAKQSTANIEALTNMPWSKDEYDNLVAQFNAVICTPEVPGSYITGRYAGFAFLDVYNDGEESVDTMLSYIDDINSELSRKRKEFGLPVEEDFKAFERKSGKSE